MGSKTVSNFCNKLAEDSQKGKQYDRVDIRYCLWQVFFSNFICEVKKEKHKIFGFEIMKFVNCKECDDKDSGSASLIEDQLKISRGFSPTLYDSVQDGDRMVAYFQGIEMSQRHARGFVKGEIFFEWQCSSINATLTSNMEKALNITNGIEVAPLAFINANAVTGKKLSYCPDFEGVPCASQKKHEFHPYFCPRLTEQEEENDGFEPQQQCTHWTRNLHGEVVCKEEIDG